MKNLLIPFRFYFFIWLLAICLTVISINSFAATTLWQFRPTAGEVDCSPAIADVDGDAVLDVVLCTTAGRVLVLDIKCRQKWFYDTQQTISIPPTVANGEKNQPIVVVLTNPGKVFCLDGKSGICLWEFSMPAAMDWGTTTIVAADVNEDDKNEFIIGDKGGNLVCLTCQGALLWSVNFKSGINCSPAVADINGDGELEILVGTAASPLICLSQNGKEIWRVKENESVGSGPVICDLNNDGKPEILVGRGDGLSALDQKGKTLWHFAMRKSIHDAIAVADINDDGKNEIVVVDLFGQVACLTAVGKALWTANVEQRVRRSPAIADIDGDSVPEIIIGGYSSALHIFDVEGNLKERFPLKATMNASPTIVDFKQDNNVTVICANNAEVLALSWLATKPTIEPAVFWSEYRANSARTGSVVQNQLKKTLRFVEIDFGKFYVGPNEFKVRADNPDKKTVSLSLEITSEAETPISSKVASADSVISLSLPYTIIGKSAVNVKFSCQLFLGKQLIAKREQTFYIVPFAKDMADLQQTVSDIKTLLPQISDQKFVEERLVILRVQLSQMETQTKLAGTLTAIERSALRDEVATLRDEVNSLSAMTRAAAVAGKKLAVYKANPWAPFAGVAEIVEGRTASPAFYLEAFAGEKESAAFNLANFSGSALVVRIEPEPICSTKDSSQVFSEKVITFHEVLDVPTQSLDYSADALPQIGQARTMILPAWSVRQLWLTVDVAALSPGQYETKIKFRSLEVEPQQSEAQISLSVWQPNLLAEQPLKLCHWGYVHSSILKDKPEAALNDQVNHGTNVFVATSDFAPKAHYDQHGNVVGAIDFTAHDEYVAQHSPHGLILFFNYQASLSGPADKFSAAWEKAYQQWLKSWIDHCLEMGLSYQDFALYPIDEPGLHEGLVDLFIGFAKPIREVDAKVQIYADPVASATLADLKKMAPYVDIWCPNRGGYLLEKNADKLTFIKSTNRVVWTYECDANAKHQSPLGYYRSQAWLVWWRGLTGIGFWSYCTSQFDPWYAPLGGKDYLLIYQGNGVVTSKRWEAVRDGIEDYSMLQQLKDAVENAANKPELAEAIQQAKRLLGKEASEIAQFCGLDEAGTQPGTYGLKRVRETEDIRWEKIKKVRREIARLLEFISTSNNHN